MQIYIQNRLRIQGLDSELRYYLKDLLTLTNPKWLEAKAFGRFAGHIPRHILQYEEEPDTLIVPRGLLSHLLEDLGREFEIIDERVSPEVLEPWPESKITLRPGDQEPAVRELLYHSNGFLSSPAGSGKTVMGLEACRRSGLRALWLTHQKELKDQTFERAAELFGLDPENIGILHGNVWKVGPQLTVGMIPTMRRRDLSEVAKLFGLVVIDEAHHVPSSTFLQVVGQFYAKHIYGLTATAYRNDKLESLMFNAIGPIVAEVQTVELFRDEHLIKPKIKLRPTNWYPPNAHQLSYHDFMEQMVTAPERNRLIVQDIIRECQPGNTIIFLAERTKHVELLTQLLKEQGVLCEFVVGSLDIGGRDKHGRKKKKALSKEVRQKIVAGFKQGEIQVLGATYDLLTEGFDYKPLNRLFLTTPVKWKGTVTQAIGRVQRPSEGKEEAIVYDYIDQDIAMFSRQADFRWSQVYRPMDLPVENYG